MKKASAKRPPLRRSRASSHANSPAKRKKEDYQESSPHERSETTMTWTDFGEILKALGAMATGGAACVGAYAALRGLHKWQEETTGKRRAEVAEEALCSFLHVRRVFAGVRARTLRINEGSTRKPELHETPELKSQRDRYFAVIERLARAQDQFINLDKLRYTFETYFGKDAAQPFDMIGEVYTTLGSSAEILIQIASANPTERDRENEMPLRNALGWGEAKRPDDIDKKLDDAVKSIEQVCRPILAERGPKI
jgi:hypothetical protein